MSLVDIPRQALMKAGLFAQTIANNISNVGYAILHYHSKSHLIGELAMSPFIVPISRARRAQAAQNLLSTQG